MSDAHRPAASVTIKHELGLSNNSFKEGTLPLSDSESYKLQQSEI
jgi:hypothetical protein